MCRQNLGIATISNRSLANWDTVPVYTADHAIARELLNRTRPAFPSTPKTISCGGVLNPELSCGYTIIPRVERAICRS